MSDDEVNERVPLTVEQALSMLNVKDGERVHTFTNPGVGMLCGADWTLARARKCFEENGVEVAGEQASSMKHGVVSIERGRAVFFETKENALAEVAS